MIEGKVIRINGPIIKATGLGGGGLYDVVEIGGEAPDRGDNPPGRATPRPSRSTRRTRACGSGRARGRSSGRSPCTSDPGSSGRSTTESSGRWRRSRRPPADSSLRESRRRRSLTGQEMAFSARVQERVIPAAPGTIVGQVRESATIMHKLIVFPEMRRRRRSNGRPPEGDYTIGETIVKFAGRHGNDHVPLLARAQAEAVHREDGNGRAADHRAARHRRLLSRFRAAGLRQSPAGSAQARP